MEFLLFDWGSQNFLPRHGFLARFHGDCVCPQFSGEEQSPLLGLPEVSEAQGENWIISYHVVAFFAIGAVDKLVPFSREMG